MFKQELTEFIRPMRFTTFCSIPKPNSTGAHCSDCLCAVCNPACFDLSVFNSTCCRITDDARRPGVWTWPLTLNAMRERHLFIALNNQTFEQTVARIEVVCPGGEPFARDHRFELKACPPPRKAVQLNAEGEDDALDWVPRYLQQGVVLWLGVAWPENQEGDRYVQVILRDESGVVIESRVLRTVVKRRTSSHTRNKNKNSERARTWANRPLPKV